MIECPIKLCKVKFLNKYSLTNHLRRSSDIKHKSYYESNVAVQSCIFCKTPLRNNRRNKNNKGLCYTCYKSKYVKKPEIKKEWLIKKCFKCKQEVLGYFSPRNTRVLCNNCSDLRVKNKRAYNKEFDKKRYKKGKEERYKIRLLKKEKLLENLILLLKEDLFTDIPIHEMCKKHHISLLSIRKVLPLIMTDKEYKERNKRIRSKAVQLRIDDLRNYLKNNSNNRNINRKPNLLEKRLGKEIQDKFPSIKLRYNKWKTLRDEINDCYAHLESDIILNFNDVRVIILLDGEAFHGKNSYFNGDTVKEDERKSRILFKYNSFVIRYSETEVKKAFAIKHISNLIKDIISNKISNYYRNWMID